MSVFYSWDLRRRVIAAYVAKEGSQHQLAQRFKMSLSFVRNLLRCYQDCGEIETKQRGGYQTFYGTKPCGYIPPVTSRNEPGVFCINPRKGGIAKTRFVIITFKSLSAKLFPPICLRNYTSWDIPKSCLFLCLKMQLSQSLKNNETYEHNLEFVIMALVGYARVSSVGQSLDIQLDKLQHCDKIYQEKKSSTTLTDY